MLLKKLLPRISATERLALQAGSLSIDRLMYENKLRVSEIRERYPRVRLTSEETKFIQDSTDVLCSHTDAYKVKTMRDLDPGTWKYLRENGFFGLCIPKEKGGLGFSQHAHSKIVEKISSRCTSTAVTVMVPNSLGPGEMLLKYGTEEQKERHLSRLASGEKLPCFGLTGPYNGSDAAATPDVGLVERRTEDGVLGIRFSCEKRWITLAPRCWSCRHCHSCKRSTRFIDPRSGGHHFAAFGYGSILWWKHRYWETPLPNWRFFYERAHSDQGFICTHIRCRDWW